MANTNIDEEIDHFNQTLQFKPNFLIIESASLSARVAKWISFGNFLHKTSTLCGLVSCSLRFLSMIAINLPPFKILHTSLALVSISTAFLYNYFWSRDLCSNYQISTRPIEIKKFIYLNKSGTCISMLLTKKNDQYRKFLHNCLALASVSPFVCHHAFNLIPISIF
uniref:Transmembrane protein 11, mitochondrial (Trinotate prediction) n=1 Tax=Myxobolus squamalis TaxID=59785 RepID=A0A6B2G6T9_MYXSQ